MEVWFRDEELVRRLAGRAVKEGRADDAEEAVWERLKVYQESTAPLVQHYGAQGLLHGHGGAPGFTGRPDDEVLGERTRLEEGEVDFGLSSLSQVVRA